MIDMVEAFFMNTHNYLYLGEGWVGGVFHGTDLS